MSDGKLSFRVKIGEKEIEVNGDSTYVKELLDKLLPAFLEAKAAALKPDTISDVVPGVEQSANGPVITSPRKTALSHAEALGVLLLASPEQANLSKTLTMLARDSGLNIRVTGRLSEMKGRVVKLPDNRWKLSAQGVEWVKRGVLPKLA
ncbi:MAG: hypothetical protein WB661_11300 [Candidatus Bathyarchaeia archaeon]